MEIIRLRAPEASRGAGALGGRSSWRSCASWTWPSRPAPAEAIDWTRALAALGIGRMDARRPPQETLGWAVKSRDDLATVRRRPARAARRVSMTDRTEPLGRRPRPGGGPARRRGAGRHRPVLLLRRAAPPVEPDDLYWAARATLVSRREDIDGLRPRLPEAFGVTAAASRRPQPVRRPAPARRPSPSRPRGPPQAGDGASETALASPVETLRRKDFAACSDAELAPDRPADGAPARCAPPSAAPAGGGPPATATRTCAAPSAGRCAPAASPSSAPGAGAGVQRRRLLLVLDVSGSMSTYSRALAHLRPRRAARRPGTGRPSRFGTRLTRHDPAPCRRRPGRRDRRRRRGGDRLGRRHPHRRLAQAPVRRARPHPGGPRRGRA